MIPVFVPTVPHRAPFRSVLAERAAVTEFLEDDQYRGSWWNVRRVLKRGVEYCRERGLAEFCVLEDDVYPVDDFQRHLTNAVASQPGKFFYLFAYYRGVYTVERATRLNPVLRAYQKGYHWAQSFSYTTCAMLCPVNFIEDFFAWVTPEREADALFNGSSDPLVTYNNSDWRLMRYMKDALGWQQFLLTVPCLVEHLGVESATKHPDSGEFQRTEICAQYFVNSLERDAWTSKVYKDV